MSGRWLHEVPHLSCSSSLWTPKALPTLVLHLKTPSRNQNFYNRYPSRCWGGTSFICNVRRVSRTRCSATSSPVDEVLTADAVLDAIYASTCPLHHTAVTVFTGQGVQLGISVEWQLKVRSDGAFREDISSAWMSFSSGFDGSFESTCWDVDSSGTPHQLQLDDHEAAILVSWVRCGAWALPALRSRLSVKFAPKQDPRVAPPSNGVTVEVRLAGGRVAVDVTMDGATWQVQTMEVKMCGDREDWAFEDWRLWELESERRVLHPVRLTHTSVNGGEQHVELRSISTLVDSLVDSLVQSSEIFERNTGLQFVMPILPELPADTTFLPDVPSTVPAWRTRSGHLLIQATINDTNDCGYFILDTGASGFVIESSAADTLKMEAFGKLHVTGMAGKIAGRFRKASTFQLGPLLMRDPIMMEMSCGGLVTGAPGPVIGIVGFEVFRRAVVEIPSKAEISSTVCEAADPNPISISSPAAALAWAAMPRVSAVSQSLGGGLKGRNGKSSLAGQANTYIRLHAPNKPDIDSLSEIKSQKLNWIPVVMLSALPHVRVQLQSKVVDDKGTDEHTFQEDALMMVDTGAGGMAAMLNADAASSLGLFSKTKDPKTRSIRGVGGSAAGAVTLRGARLSNIRVGNIDFSEVSCLVAERGSGGGVELSYCSAGILCGELLERMRLVVDIPHGRIHFEECCAE